MITTKCDNCDKPIEAPDDQAGKKIKCPACGDVNVLPGKPASSPDRAAAKGFPPAGGPEQTIIRARPEMFRSKPGLFLLHVLALIAAVAGVGYFTFSGQKSGGGQIGFGIVGVIALVSFLVWKIKTMGTALEITTRRSIERVGLLSKFTSEILHDDVRNIQITQSFRERLLGVGSIGISSAAQNEVEIVAKHVRNPDRIREVIDAYRPM